MKTTLTCLPRPQLLYILLFLVGHIASSLHAQFGNNKAFAKIDFHYVEQDWDGFGINYVETCQTPDYIAKPQDLGGFTILSESQKQEVIDLVFGEQGLRPSIIKMFLDPWHLAKKGGSYDHEWTTQHMRYFVREGLKKANMLGDSLQAITTLYGPPAFMTQHHDPANSLLDPAYKKDLALYMVDWVSYLREKERFPVRYLSIHNEGTDWLRWPMYEGVPNSIQEGRDYNLLWRGETIADFLAYMRPIMDEHGLEEIGLTPGEPINLFRFDHFGIADEIAANPEALKSLGLITSHGFGLGNGFGRSYANADNQGARTIQKYRPEIHTWITSMSWGKMDTRFGMEIYEHIYGNNVNAIIPWAFIQRYSHWYDTNFHPGLAINVTEDSTLVLQKGYYLYKQFTRAGRQGMKVVKTSINRPEVFIAAFAQNQTPHPDAFVVINYGESQKYVSDLIELSFSLGEKNLYYAFAVKDPKLSLKQQTPEQMQGVEFNAHASTQGYTMEFAFPWETLGSKPDSSFSFGISVRDGRDMPHGKIGWQGVVPGLTSQGRIMVDGNAEKPWEKEIRNALKINQMPGTPPQISGSWRMLHDAENLYLLVEVQDPSSDLGRRMVLDIRNTECTRFQAFRTDEFEENYDPIGEFELREGKLEYLSPNHSITTFIGVE